MKTVYRTKPNNLSQEFLEMSVRLYTDQADWSMNYFWVLGSFISNIILNIILELCYISIFQCQSIKPQLSK